MSFFSLFITSEVQLQCCNRENMFLALVVGLGVHLVVSCGINNLPLLHASEGKLDKK